MNSLISSAFGTGLFLGFFISAMISFNNAPEDPTKGLIHYRQFWLMLLYGFLTAVMAVITMRYRNMFE